MKTPRIEDFHPGVAEKQTLASPLDAMPTIEKPRTPHAVPSSTTNELAQKSPASKIIRPTVNRQQDKANKFDKYSTYLRPGYLKKIKLAALEKDCDSYEILDEALTLYFDDLKK
jgi:hypothetical protein